MVGSDAKFALVKRLAATGRSDRAIAAEVGVSPGTVRRWRVCSTAPGTVLRAALRTSWNVEDAESYCYLLGVYLGDGTVSHQPPDYWDLRVVNDRQYQGISSSILRAMATTFPGGSVRRYESWRGESDILHVAHPAVPRAFPQHGPGPKHLRPIALADWQRELTHAHAAALIRGLIHSDGCRCINRFQTRLPSGRVREYEYVRYFFTNQSGQIRDIFREHCGLLGVRVTQPNPRNLAVSHRASVAILESIVGPKT